MAMFMLLGKSISAAFLLLLIIEMVGWKEEEKRESINLSKVKRSSGDIQRVIDVHENKQVNIINIVTFKKGVFQFNLKLSFGSNLSLFIDRYIANIVWRGLSIFILL